MTDLVAINGTIFEAASAQVPIHDRAFLFGDGILETLAAIGSRLIDFEAHLHRLRRAAESCHINMPWSDSFLQFEIENLLSLSRFERSSIRILLSRGVGTHLVPHGEEVTQRYIFCSAAPNNKHAEESGVRLKLRRDPLGRKGEQIKWPFYLPTVKALIELKETGHDDVLWVNAEGDLTEAGFSNLFLLAREGDLVEIATPPVQSGILPGVTRARIIELLERSKIPVTERSISIEELPRFDEGFLSSSVRGLVPIQTIDKHRLHSLRPQSVYRQIKRLYTTWEIQEGGSSSQSPTH